MFQLRKIFLKILIFLTLFLSFIFLFSNIWIKNNFGNYVSYDEIIFNVKLFLNFTKEVNSLILPPRIFYSFLYEVVFKSFLSSGIIILLYFLILKYWFSIYGYIKSIKVYKKKINIILVCFFFLFSFLHFLLDFKFFELIYNNDKNLLFKDKYVDAKKLNFLKPKKLKNLIFIFYESADKNFPNIILTRDKEGSVVEYEDREDVHKSLRNIEGFEIDNFIQAKSLGWSMAGMVAAQCSVPFFGDTRIENVKDFSINKLTCISDILKDYGYEQFFFTSGEKKFHHMDQFYLSHGFQKIYDKTDYLLNGIDRKNFGSFDQGLHDDILLDQAFDKIKELSDKQTPFNVVLSTTDTHDPYNYMSPSCKDSRKYIKNFEDHYYLRLRDSFKCTGKFISKFIKRLKKEGIFQNTLIVISGDHLAPSTKNLEPYLKKSEENPEKNRRIFFKIINSTNEPRRDLMSHFDIGPTILNDLNILSLNQDKFGLGLSLYSPMKQIDYYNEYIDILSSNNLNRIFNKYINLN